MSLAELGEHKVQTNETCNEALLTLQGLGRNATLSPVDLQVCKGEVVGLAGLLGSGRTELCRLIFGVDKKHSGTVMFNGKAVNFSSPRDAIDAGMGLCPEDRKHDGILGQLSIRENMILARQIKQGWWKE